jgi:TolB protein
MTVYGPSPTAGDHMKFQFPRVLTLLVITSALLSAELLPPPSAGGDDANEGFILFTSDRANPSPLGMCTDCEDIYVMSPDGSNPIRLTEGGADKVVGRAPYLNSGADWSHSKKLIAFHTNRGGFPEIFRMNVDGSEQLVLASLGARGAVFPSFSHNGNELCFNSQVRPRDIYIVNAHGDGLTNLTNQTGDSFRCDWSPKGNDIAFGSSRDGNEEIYAMNADGSGLRRLTTAAGSDANPAFSPKGDLIAFESNRQDGPEIWVMNSDGTEEPVRLTFFAAEPRPRSYSLTKPTWSPTGDRIAFQRRMLGPKGPGELGHFEIFTMNTDGSDVTRITFTDDPGFSGFPSWGKWSASEGLSVKQ